VQELLRDDSMPYAEFYQRPGSSLDYAIEWAGFLSNRWFPGLPFDAGYAIRPRCPTGFQYVAQNSGLSAHAPTSSSPWRDAEPAWPLAPGQTVQDGSITWKCAAVDTTSLASTISASSWTSDGGVSVGARGLVGTRAGVLVIADASLADGDYYVRNTISLASTVTPEGLLRISVRARKL